MIIDSNCVKAVCDGQILSPIDSTLKCDVYVDYPIEEFSTVFFKVVVDENTSDKTVEAEVMPRVTVQGMISNAHTKLEITSIDWEVGSLTLRKTDIEGNV